MSLIDSLKDCSDSILGIRESIGADLRKIYLVTRTWSGEMVGDGLASDESVKIEPTPGIKNLSNDHRVKEGGAVQNGDLLIHQISKYRYPEQKDIDCSSDLANVERFYQVGDVLYTVINTVEKHLVWDVQIRRRSDQRSAEALNNV